MRKFNFFYIQIVKRIRKNKSVFMLIALFIHWKNFFPFKKFSHFFLRVILQKCNRIYCSLKNLLYSKRNNYNLWGKLFAYKKTPGTIYYYSFWLNGFLASKREIFLFILIWRLVLFWEDFFFLARKRYFLRHFWKLAEERRWEMDLLVWPFD